MSNFSPNDVRMCRTGFVLKIISIKEFSRQNLCEKASSAADIHHTQALQRFGLAGIQPVGDVLAIQVMTDVICHQIESKAVCGCLIAPEVIAEGLSDE
eukprot:scaffold87887_cov35-Prasinocladus_malaysianus.AAC.1